MKKLTILTMLILTTLIFTERKLNAQEKTSPSKFQKPSLDIPFEEKTLAIKKLKEILETKKRMREIEKEAIENDAELRKYFEQIITLRKELREKLDEKLKDNQEYQKLKERLREIEEKIKEKISERKEVK